MSVKCPWVFCHWQNLFLFSTADTPQTFFCIWRYFWTNCSEFFPNPLKKSKVPLANGCVYYVAGPVNAHTHTCTRTHTCMHTVSLLVNANNLKCFLFSLSVINWLGGFPSMHWDNISRYTFKLLLTNITTDVTQSLMDLFYSPILMF